MNNKVIYGQYIIAQNLGRMSLELSNLFKKSTSHFFKILGCNCGPELYQNCSRDPARTPMQWSGSEINAGFSTSNHTWLPVNPNYITINVDSELLEISSHLNIYKRLQEKFSPTF